MDFPILADPEKTAAKAYDVLLPIGFANRWTFYIGPDGKLLDVDKNVSPKTAGRDVAAKLEALKVPKRREGS